MCCSFQLAGCRRKLALLVILCLLICCPLFSDSCIVTAFKRTVSTDPSTETPFVNVRIIGPDDSSVSSSVEDYSLELPENARSNDYHAFSWVVSGNAYRDVIVSLRFKPMILEKDNSQEILPYYVKLNHTYTRIGNYEVPFSIDTENLGSPLIYESKKYYFCDTVYYADARLSPYNQQKSFKVSSSDTNGVAATFKYSMGTSTVVQEYSNRSWTTINYSGNVCSYWNRLGDVYVNVDIPSNPSGYSSGDYVATVEITIMSGS